MSKPRGVSRPIKRSEYHIECDSRGAAEGWNDLKATKLNALADAWDFLTRTPTARSETAHPLKGQLATVVRAGIAHTQWQYELPGGGRIWYFVTEPAGRQPGIVTLVRVATSHPNETK